MRRGVGPGPCGGPGTGHPGEAPLTGRQAIGATLRTAFARGAGLTTFPEGAAPQLAGEWLAVFRRRPGAWSNAADACNSDAPPSG